MDLRPPFPVDLTPEEEIARFEELKPRLDAVWQALVDRSVLVRNCSGWPGLQGCLRVTIGTPDDDDRFLTALREVLS